MLYKRHYDIDAIRCILTVILVTFHSFCPFNSWSLPHGLSQNETYYWLDKFIFQGMLETFVCISGYLYFARYKNRTDVKISIQKKLFRLYMPAIFWGTLYAYFLNSNVNIHDIINGVGHLWFLPMLFCLFVLEELWIAKISSKYLLPTLLFIAILPYPTLPLYFNKTLYYLFFFHLGQWIFNNKKLFREIILKRIKIPQVVLILISVFFLLNCHINLETPFDGQPIREKATLIFLQRVLEVPMATAMIFLYWKFSDCTKESISKTPFWLSFSNLSFGIYIIHEFVLKLLYYHTYIPHYLENWSPWCFLIISIIISFTLSHIINTTKFLKFLLGN